MMNIVEDTAIHSLAWRPPSKKMFLLLALAPFIEPNLSAFIGLSSQLEPMSITSAFLKEETIKMFWKLWIRRMLLPADFV